VQVVQNDEQPLAWIALAQPLEGLADVDHALVFAKQPPRQSSCTS